MQVTDANFDVEVLQADKPVLVDFYADWCGPCQMMAPIIEELAGELTATAKVVKLDVDANPQTAQQYGIMSIPTIGIFKGGRQLTQLIGLQDKESLKTKLQEMAGQ